MEGREYKEKLRLLKQENNEMRMEISGTYVHIIVFIIFHNFHYIDNKMRITELMKSLEEKEKK